PVAASLLGRRADPHAEGPKTAEDGLVRDVERVGELLGGVLAEHVGDGQLDHLLLRLEFMPEAHRRLPPLPGLLDLLRLAAALPPDALEEPVAVGGRHLQHLGHAHPQPRAAVLPPTHLEHAFPPAIEVYPGKEVLRSRRLAVLSLP